MNRKELRPILPNVLVNENMSKEDLRMDRNQAISKSLDYIQKLPGISDTEDMDTVMSKLMDVEVDGEPMTGPMLWSMVQGITINDNAHWILDSTPKGLAKAKAAAKEFIRSKGKKLNEYSGRLKDIDSSLVKLAQDKVDYANLVTTEEKLKETRIHKSLR